MRLPLALILGLAIGCEANPVPTSTSKEPARFTRVDGTSYQLPAQADCKAIVLFFIGHDCPISNGYAPEINRIVKDYGPRGVHCCVVYVEADLGSAEARKHAKEFGYDCPAILDPELKLARQFGAKVMPEAAVLSARQELLYLGRIDDRYADYGKLRPALTKMEVRDAIDAVLAGQSVKVSRAPAIGCDIHFPK